MTPEERKEKERAYAAEYRKANRAQIAAKMRARYAANRDAELVRREAYRVANKEKEAARRRRYREENEEKDLAYRREYGVSASRVAYELGRRGFPVPYVTPQLVAVVQLHRMVKRKLKEVNA